MKNSLLAFIATALAAIALSSCDTVEPTDPGVAPAPASPERTGDDDAAQG